MTSAINLSFSPLLKVQKIYTVRNFLRFYKTKTNEKKFNEKLTQEQLFLKRVLKYNGDVHSSEFIQWTERLNFLASKGFKRYTVIQYPKVLTFSPQEIEAKLEVLKNKLNTSVISDMPLLKFADKHPSRVRKLCFDYFRNKSESNSGDVEEVRRLLNCSDDEMMSILAQNPRLFGQKMHLNLVPKIKCLLRHGASIEDLKANTFVLNNKTLEVIESRATALKRLNCVEPMPLGPVSRTEQGFDRFIRAYAEEEGGDNNNNSGGNDNNNNNFPEALNVLKKIPQLKRRKLYLYKMRINYLLSKGYRPREIIDSPTILLQSYTKIKNSVEYFERYYLKVADLRLCLNYILRKSMVIHRKPCSLLGIAKVLGIKTKEMVKLPSDLKIIFPLTETEIGESLEFFLDLGFEKEIFKQFPLVLCNGGGVAVLEKYWGIVNREYANLLKKNNNNNDDNDNNNNKNNNNNKMFVLELLQYSIERDCGFNSLLYNRSIVLDYISSSSSNIPAVAVATEDNNIRGDDKLGCRRSDIPPVWVVSGRDEGVDGRGRSYCEIDEIYGDDCYDEIGYKVRDAL